jgi:hypothetical protein
MHLFSFLYLKREASLSKVGDKGTNIFISSVKHDTPYTANKEGIGVF